MRMLKHTMSDNAHSIFGQLECADPYWGCAILYRDQRTSVAPEAVDTVKDDRDISRKSPYFARFEINSRNATAIIADMKLGVVYACGEPLRRTKRTGRDELLLRLRSRL